MQSSCQCHILANVIASHVVENGKFEATDQESFKLDAKKNVSSLKSINNKSSK